MGQLRGPATGTGGAAKRSQLCHGGMKKIEPYRDHSGNPHYRYFPPEIGVVFKFSFTQVPNGLVCSLMAPRRMGSYCRLSPSLAVMWQKSSRWQSTNHLPCPDMFSGLGNVHHKSLVFRAFSWVAGPSCWFCLYIDAWWCLERQCVPEAPPFNLHCSSFAWTMMWFSKRWSRTSPSSILFLPFGSIWWLL